MADSNPRSHTTHTNTQTTARTTATPTCSDMRRDARMSRSGIFCDATPTYSIHRTKKRQTTLHAASRAAHKTSATGPQASVSDAPWVHHAPHRSCRATRTPPRQFDKKQAGTTRQSAYLPLLPECLGLLGEILSALLRYGRHIQPDDAGTRRLMT